MNYLTADDGFQDRLRGVMETVEIRDASGKVLGHFTPATSPEEEETYARAAKLFDLDEMERLAATEHDGFSIEQVTEYLRSLERPQ
jgi:hypothetical protein